MKISSLQWSPDRIATYWDQRAQEVGSLTGAFSTGCYRRSEIRVIKRFFNNTSGKKILKLDLWNEINNTQILIWLAEQGGEVYGLDISPYLVNQTQKLFAELRMKGKFIVCDMREIAFKDNFFDYVYTMGTIEHVSDYDRALKEIYRVLKPGGKAIIGVPNKFDPFLRPFLVWFLTKLGKYPYAPEKSFTFGELEREIKKVGFKIEARTGLLFMPGVLRMIDVYSYRKLHILSKIVTLILKPFNFLEDRFPFFERNGYLIASVCRK